MVVVLQTPNSHSLVITASREVVGFDLAVILFVSCDRVHAVDGQRVGGHDPDGGFVCIVDLPQSRVYSRN